MSALNDCIDVHPWPALSSYRRARPLEQARGWRALVRVSWLSRRAVLAALALAVLGHLALLLAWLQETPRPPPPLAASERLSVQLLDPVVPLPAAPIAAVESPAPTEAAAQQPVARASRPAVVAVEPEVTAPVSTDARGERVAIDWRAAINGAARSQVTEGRAETAPSLGAPIPRLPGERSDQWSQPAVTPAQRLQQVGQMMSQDQLVGGDGLHSLVAAGPMEQEINRRIRDLQSECHPTADGRLRCPQRRR